MAETENMEKKGTTTTTSRKKTSTKAKTTKTTTAASKKAAAVAELNNTYKVKTIVDPNMEIPVINGFHGVLSYVGKKSRETFLWSEYGDVQIMEFGELRDAVATSKRHFTDNWFLFDDPAVIAALGVEKYYTHAVLPDNVDTLLSLPTAELKREIIKMSIGQKNTLKYMVREKIIDGEIDSLSTIRALGEALGVSFIEEV